VVGGPHKGEGVESLFVDDQPRRSVGRGEAEGHDELNVVVAIILMAKAEQGVEIELDLMRFVASLRRYTVACGGQDRAVWGLELNLQLENR
jgi:hypothetical protein